METLISREEDLGHRHLQQTRFTNINGCPSISLCWVIWIILLASNGVEDWSDWWSGLTSCLCAARTSTAESWRAERGERLAGVDWADTAHIIVPGHHVSLPHNQKKLLTSPSRFLFSHHKCHSSSFFSSSSGKWNEAIYTGPFITPMFAFWREMNWPSTESQERERGLFGRDSSEVKSNIIRRCRLVWRQRKVLYYLFYLLPLTSSRLSARCQIPQKIRQPLLIFQLVSIFRGAKTL